MSKNAQSGAAEGPQSDAGHSNEAATPAADDARETVGGGSGSGRRLRRTTGGAVVLLLLLAAVSYQFDLGTRWFGWEYPSPIDQPAEVAPPPGLTIPALASASVVARPTPPEPVDAEKVRRALAGPLTRPQLGPRVSVDVERLDGAPVYEHGPQLVTPASTMKLLTTTAALEALGRDHRFRTRVLAPSGTREIVLVGGGDPLLSPAPVSSPTAYPAVADLTTLARSTARALKAVGRSSVRLRYDASLFTGPTVNPHWPATYIPQDVVSPISPLWVNEGRLAPGADARSPRPAAAAAEVFAQALARQKIKVVGPVQAQTAPPGSAELAAVQSAPLGEIVQHILEVSDNEGAEVLLRQVALKEGQPATFEGGVRAVRAVLRRLGIDTSGETILDGSGLSRSDRVKPATLLAALQTAASARHPELRDVVADLPVAGFTGTLTYRFQSAPPAGLGLVRAKTGTLTGVHSLAGVVTTTDGAVLMFTAVADRVKLPNTLAARADLDDIAAALAGCACAETKPAASGSASPTGTAPSGPATSGTATSSGSAPAASRSPASDSPTP